MAVLSLFSLVAVGVIGLIVSIGFPLPGNELFLVILFGTILFILSGIIVSLDGIAESSRKIRELEQ